MALQKHTYVPLVTTANKQGRIAGINAAGGLARFGGVVGTAVVKTFDLTIAHTGLTQKCAQYAGFDADAVLISLRLLSVQARNPQLDFPMNGRNSDGLSLLLHMKVG